jgi:hypothetical protein
MTDDIIYSNLETKPDGVVPAQCDPNMTWSMGSYCVSSGNWYNFDGSLGSGEWNEQSATSYADEGNSNSNTQYYWVVNSGGVWCVKYCDTMP